MRIASELMTTSVPKAQQSPLNYFLLFALAADAANWVSGGTAGALAESIATTLLLNAALGVYEESKSVSCPVGIRITALGTVRHMSRQPRC